MKKISIAKKMDPFSHSPGTEFFLAGSTLAVKVFPCRLEVRDVAAIEGKTTCDSLTLFLTGPVKKYSVFQNIEKQKLEVFGHFEEGYIRYEVTFDDEGALVLLLLKGPKSGVSILWNEKKEQITPKGKLTLIKSTHKVKSEILEKLSLGVHKACDWDLIQRRKDLKEIFPFWFQLGQTLEKQTSSEFDNGYLFKKCEEAVIEKNKKDLEEAFLVCFQSSFSGVLVPQMEDNTFQGLIPQEATKALTSKESPLFLLRNGYELIRRCFIEKKADLLSVLTCLPVSFHSGRMTNIVVEGVGVLSIEWSKKMLKKIELKATHDISFTFNLQKAIKTFRMRNLAKKKGSKMTVSDFVSLENGKSYFFDRFEK